VKLCTGITYVEVTLIGHVPVNDVSYGYWTKDDILTILQPSLEVTVETPLRFKDSAISLAQKYFLGHVNNTYKHVSM